jgi:hypothetical protein
MGTFFQISLSEQSLRADCAVRQGRARRAAEYDRVSHEHFDRNYFAPEGMRFGMSA